MTKKPDFPATVGIVGLGVMGGSLARALKARPDPPRIRAAARDPDDLRRAEREGVVDEVCHRIASAVEGCDLVVYATPLRATLELLRTHREVWSPGTAVTDVVSLKGPVMEAVEALGIGERFVGGHPMVGSERSGFQGARRELYDGGRVWLVRGTAGARVAGRVEVFWRGVGADPAWIQAGDHDLGMAWCSHLPQLLSNALAGALDVAGFPPAALGPGGRDMVRLAGSSPAIWRELLEVSAPTVGPALRSVSRGVEVLAGLLEAGDLDGVIRFMERTRAWRGEG